MRFLRYVLFGCLLLPSQLACPAWGETEADPVESTASVCQTHIGEPARVYPFVEMGCGHRLTYLGTYSSDGKYRPEGSPRRIVEAPPSNPDAVPSLRPADVPPLVNLHPRERLVQNFSPVTPGVQNFRSHSELAEWRDDLLTAVYGHEKALLAPSYLTTDSDGRVIVSDPAVSSVHVLDAEHPFRIEAGKNLRLQSVGPVAVDGSNNIYIADPVASVVLVFDRNGRFIRELGKFSADEGLFHSPAGIAIDRESKQLFVVDATRDMLFVLDLEGNVLNRAGGRRHEAGITLNHPTAIAVKNDRVAVLDSQSTRIQVLDVQCKLLLGFVTRQPDGSEHATGIEIDSDGRIYVSDVHSGSIRIYDRSGHLQSVFGTGGYRRGELLEPAALWIDDHDRLFVAEKQNRRVQVFQIGHDEMPRNSEVTEPSASAH